MDALIAAVYELHTETVEYLIGAVSQCERSAEGGGRREDGRKGTAEIEVD